MPARNSGDRNGQRALPGGTFLREASLPRAARLDPARGGIGALVSRIGAETNDNLSLPGTGSQEATDLLAENFPPQQNGQSPIVFYSAKGKVTDSANEQAIESSYKTIVKVPHVYSAADPFARDDSPFVSEDEKTAYISVLMDNGANDLTEEEAEAVLDAADPGKKAGMQVAAGGPIGSELSEPATESSEVIAAAALIMIRVFGSFILNGNLVVKQFGVGLAVAVALAATMVLLLTPALLVLMRKATWWLPGWLGRVLPHMDIEGEAFWEGPEPVPEPAPAAQRGLTKSPTTPGGGA